MATSAIFYIGDNGHFGHDDQWKLAFILMFNEHQSLHLFVLHLYNLCATDFFDKCSDIHLLVSY